MQRAGFSPDLGEAYMRAGVTNATVLFFYGPVVEHISVMTRDALCASVGIDYEGDPHLATFDFDLNQFKALIRDMFEPEQSAEIIALCTRTKAPGTFTLPYPIQIPAIRCRLGRPKRGAHDSFVPFVVKHFQTELGTDS